MADQAIDTEGDSYAPNEAINTPAPADDSGAAPVSLRGYSGVQDDSTGVDQQAQQQAPQQAIPENPEAQSGMGRNAAMNNNQKIVSYILADKAAPPQTLDELGRVVDPGNRMSPADRNLVALDYVTTTKGPEAAVPILQANQKAFTAYQNTALAAVNGSQTKPADLKYATDAANKAQEHLLDGSHIAFAPGPNGSVTATVSAHGAERPETYSLDTNQFKSFLDMKQGGLWDKQMGQGGAAAVLKSIVGDQQPQQEEGAAAGGKSANADTPERTNNSAMGDTADAIRRYKAGEYDDALQEHGQKRVKPSDEEAESAKENAALQEQARRIFPWASQSQKREQWIAQQQSEAAGRQNKIDVENAKGGFKVKTQETKNTGMAAVANIRADAVTKAAAAHYEQEAMKQAQISRRDDDRRAAAIFRSLVNDPNAVLRNPGDVERLAAQAGVRLNGIEKFQPTQQQGAAPQAPTPQANTPQAKTSSASWTPQTLPPAGQRQVGGTITTDKGTYEWTGSGWKQR
jgi:hypothetical protein